MKEEELQKQTQEEVRVNQKQLRHQAASVVPSPPADRRSKATAARNKKKDHDTTTMRKKEHDYQA